MKQAYLLITERFDRNGTSEGANHLLFDDHETAVDFARRLTLWGAFAVSYKIRHLEEHNY